MQLLKTSQKLKWHCGGCLIKQAARYARRQAPATNQHNEQKPSNRRKSKAAAKIRRHAQAFRVRRIFYAAAIYCFLTARSFRRCYSHRFFCAPFILRQFLAAIRRVPRNAAFYLPFVNLYRTAIFLAVFYNVKCCQTTSSLRQVMP